MGQIITYEELKGIVPPPATDTYVPIAHHQIVDMFVEVADANLRDFERKSMYLEVNKEGNQFFGALSYANSDPLSRLCLGFRNSIDKSLAFGGVGGRDIIVCSNMEFHGDLIMHRKHTGNILEDLEIIIYKIVRGASYNYRHLIKTVNAYKVLKVRDIYAYRLIGQLWGDGILRTGQASEMMKEWKNPSFPEFEERNFHSLYNAGTFALKKCPINMMMRQHRRFHLAMNDVFIDWDEQNIIDDAEEDSKVIGNDPADLGYIDTEPQI